MVVGLVVDFVAGIRGRVAASAWDFGDGAVLSNQPYSSHIWHVAGDYAVVLRAYNMTFPEGVSVMVTIRVLPPVHYVSATSANPAPPYASWETAAHTIQEAVDTPTVPGALVMVTNGLYAPVTINKAITVQSSNGPGVTVLDGGGSTRCAYVGAGAVLSGFTLTNGHADNGAGVYCDNSGVVKYCVIVGNSAHDDGGGAYGGTLNNCTLTGNSAYYNGGGASGGTLKNCTLTGNSARDGGGAYAGALHNCTLTGNLAFVSGGGARGGSLDHCIVYYNTAPYGANCYGGNPGIYLYYCCTTPDPASGVGNITAEPLFVSQLNGNLRLQSNSPCINAGLDAYAPGVTDLDGRPRIVGGAVDIGAYEYQGAGMGEFIAWLAQYGLPTDGSADCTDPDGDQVNSRDEWVAGTDPTSRTSCLRACATTSATGAAITVQSCLSRLYTLLSCADLAGAAWKPVPGQIDIPGTGGPLTLTDPNPPFPAFYRVSVRLP